MAKENEKKRNTMREQKNNNNKEKNLQLFGQKFVFYPYLIRLLDHEDDN